jgi:hypothetical protein
MFLPPYCQEGDSISWSRHFFEELSASVIKAAKTGAMRRPMRLCGPKGKTYQILSLVRVAPIAP